MAEAERKLRDARGGGARARGRRSSAGSTPSSTTSCARRGARSTRSSRALRHEAPSFAEQARRAAITVNTGGSGRRASPRRDRRSIRVVDARADAEAAPANAARRTRRCAEPEAAARRSARAGVRVTVGALGLEGVVIEIHGKQAEVDVRGKRLRAARAATCGSIGGAPPTPRPQVNVDLQPRERLALRAERHRLHRGRGARRGSRSSSTSRR